MSPFPFSEPVERIVPAAVLRIWGRTGSRVLEKLEESGQRSRIVYPLGHGRWLALPLPGDPAIFDRAVAFATEALRTASASAVEIRALIVPGAARIGDSIRLLDEPLLAELEGQKPTIEAGKVLLTSHAAHQLESPHAVERSGTLTLEGGRQIPLVTVSPVSPPTPTLRNVEVLSRTLKWVPRPEPESALISRLNEPLLRVEGALGAGKTRFVWETLHSGAEPAIWRDAARSGLPPIEKALAAESSRTLRVVYDHVDMARPELWAEIEEMLKHPSLGKGLRLTFIARPGLAWPAPLAATAPLTLPPMDGEAWSRFAMQLFRGLSLPDRVAEDHAAGAGGNPFALEESLLYLVRDRKLRQVFGSFFFSGSDGSPSQLHPSARFVTHVEAEALRLGSPLPLRLLTQSEDAVPTSELGSAIQALGAPRPHPEWAERYVEAGLLVAGDGPWGEGNALASGAVRGSFASTLPAESATRLRLDLGELLAARSSTAEELWASYRLLAGREEGAHALLAAAAGSGRLPREALFTALRHELASLADRSQGPEASRDLETELLWVLLPLARRMGRLHELAPALERGFELSREQPQRFLSIAALRADLAQSAGRFAEAESVLRQALAASRDGDNRRKERLLVELGRVLSRQGKSAEARELFTRMLDVSERRGRRGLAAECRYLLANIAFHDFRLDEARELHERALAERREQKIAGVPASLTALGSVALAQGDPTRSLAWFEEAQKLLAAEGSDGEEAFALIGAGRALTRLGDVAGAAPALRRALALREKRDDATGEAIARLAVAESLLLLDQPDNALAEARKAHFALSLQPEGEALADAEQLLGRIQSRLRRHDLAIAHFEEASRLHAALSRRASLLADWSHRILAEIGRGQVEMVRTAYDTLVAARDAAPDAPSMELHEYSLFLAADWLETRHRGRGAPLAHLERSYRELMRQTGLLDRGMRQRFLFEVPLNRSIVEAATRRGLSLPES
jgi:tetratricopeptide (TPR) repeat protein